MPNSHLPLLSLDIDGLDKHISGKVREVFDLGKSLLIVATDRISAFDVILPTGIPGKGQVLTQLSRYWFESLTNIVKNHVEDYDIDEITDWININGGIVTSELREILDNRSMLVEKCSALPVECVARGYISGSLWNEYKKYPAHGGEITLHGVKLPVGLRESDKLPEPIFTPASKPTSGHDENISFEQMNQIVGPDLATKLRDITLKLYTTAADQALKSGVIIADTKFEFGLKAGEIIWIDEALTPDSSRFWDAASYRPGQAQASFDKQFVRDYLETLDWDKSYPGPVLPDDVIAKTAAKYEEAYERVTATSRTTR